MSNDPKPQRCPKPKWIIITICSAGNEVFRCPHATGIKKEDDGVYAQKASLTPDDPPVYELNTSDPMNCYKEQVRPKVSEAPSHHRNFAPLGIPFQVAYGKRSFSYTWKSLLAKKCFYDEFVYEQEVVFQHFANRLQEDLGYKNIIRAISL